MKREYGLIVCNFVDESMIAEPLKKPAMHPALVLRTVLLNERLKFYPQDIIIGNGSKCTKVDLRSNGESVDIGEFLSDVQDDVLEQLHDCPYLGDDEAEDWNKMIMSNGNEEAIVVLLITLFPNLHLIQTDNFQGCNLSAGNTLFNTIMTRIAEAHVDLDPCNPPMALRKLVSVDLQAGVDERVDFTVFQSFAVLPSIQHIGGNIVQSADFRWSFEPHISGVQSINFEFSEVAAQSFVELFRGIKALEKFVYTDGDTHYDVDFRPRAIVAGLLKYAAHSLTELGLTGFMKVIDKTNLGEYYIGPLHGFRTLKKICVNDVMLFRPTNTAKWEEAEYEESNSGKSNPINPPHHNARYGSYEVKRLVDILPASVELLELAGKTIWNGGEASV